MEVTEESMGGSGGGGGDSASESGGRSSGRLTPRPVSEHAASIHEPEAIVRRERTVRKSFFQK